MREIFHSVLILGSFFSSKLAVNRVAACAYFVRHMLLLFLFSFFILYVFSYYI